MDAVIRTIAHKDQRYDTVGDWQDTFDIGPPRRAQLVITVSRLPDWRYEFLIALHELIEAALCGHRGITAAQVDEFDMSYAGDGEPGADPRAPYHVEHEFAWKVEQEVAAQLGVDMEAYTAAIDALDYTPDRDG